MDRQPTTYILASQRNGTLYTGVTSDLIARIWQHRSHAVPGFTAAYRVTCLVWYELHETMEPAISRERQIKHRQRAWKIRLIEAGNPYWNDLWPMIIGQHDTGSPPSRG